MHWLQLQLITGCSLLVLMARYGIAYLVLCYETEPSNIYYHCSVKNCLLMLISCIKSMLWKLFAGGYLPFLILIKGSEHEDIDQTWKALAVL